MKRGQRALAVGLAAAVACACACAGAAGPVPLGTVTIQVKNGVPVADREAPWQVALIKRNGVDHVEGVFCGGTLINDRWVLTAAHCLYTPGTCNRFGVGEFWVAHSSPRLGKSARLVSADDAIVAPGYQCDTKANDLALVRLSEPVDTTARVRLATAQQAAAWLTKGTTVKSSGWGLTEHNVNSRDLLKVDLRVADIGACIKQYGSTTPPASICAGGDEKDTCTGDSGGPLWVGSGTTALQLGVVSRGDGCGKATAPGIYAPVMAHLPWIESTTAPPACVQTDRPDSLC